MLPSPSTPQNGAGSAPVILPGVGTQPDAPTELLHTKAAFLSPAEGDPDAMEGIDPFDLWAATSGKPLTSPPASETSTQRSPVRRAKSDPRSRPLSAQQGRRKLVTLLAVGTAAVLGVSSVSGISFAHLVGSMKRLPWQTDDGPSAETISIDPHRGKGWRKGGPHRMPPQRMPPQRPKPTPTPTGQPTPTPTPTQQPPPTPTPTQQPSPTPTPTGTVIGYTNQATNSAASFTNPADGQAGWLVHMSNGNFVAVEQACTHAGVAVKYNASTGQFNCPAHGAIFNADGTNPQPPASKPLPPVHITVNANGTITTP
jgi:Rieske Fe-S protein